MPRLENPRFATDCTVTFDGHAVPARSGESVASALLAAGRLVVSRSAKYHRPRGPFCLSGSCGSCLVRIDGEPNRRACRTPCRGPGFRGAKRAALRPGGSPYPAVLQLVSAI